jgi:hypothetical protein
MGVDVNQWEKLVVYWEECNTKKKSKQLATTRGVVQHVSAYGRGENAWVEAKLVSDYLCMLMHLDLGFQFTSLSLFQIEHIIKNHGLSKPINIKNGNY